MRASVALQAESVWLGSCRGLLRCDEESLEERGVGVGMPLLGPRWRDFDRVCMSCGKAVRFGSRDGETLEGGV